MYQNNFNVESGGIIMKNSTLVALIAAGIAGAAVIASKAIEDVSKKEAPETSDDLWGDEDWDGVYDPDWDDASDNNKSKKGTAKDKAPMFKRLKCTSESDSDLEISEDTSENLRDAIDAVMREAELDLDSDPDAAVFFRDVAEKIVVDYVNSIRQEADTFELSVMYPDANGIYPNLLSRNDDECGILRTKLHSDKIKQRMDIETIFNVIR